MDLSPSSLGVGLARLGRGDQVISCGSLQQLVDHNMGPPLHCLILPSELHPIEIEVDKFYPPSLLILFLDA